MLYCESIELFAHCRISSGDFKVDGKWTFEVGGEKKTFKQISEVPNSFVLADDIEYPRGNKLPLWMIGLLY